MYKCECCNKEIMKTSNWKSHVETEKHILNLESAKIKNKNLKICDKCGSVFIHATTYNRHSKICEKNILELANYEENNKKEIDKIMEENKKLREENEILKENTRYFEGEINILIKYEKENQELKEELKYIKNENKSLNDEIKLLNNEVKQILIDSKIEFKQVMTDSNNKIEESKNNIITICDKQLSFAQNISKDSNKITNSAMSLLSFLQKQCPNAAPLKEFTKANYEYTFTVDDDFVYDILYSFDINNAGEFIGKIINSIFLKKNKEDQSIFATDVVRCNYSIKEYIDENKDKWALDKGANKVKNMIINPLLSYITKELKHHVKKENDKIIDSCKDEENDDRCLIEDTKSEHDESTSSSDDEQCVESDSDTSFDDDDYMTRTIKNINKKKIIDFYNNSKKEDKLVNKNNKELSVKDKDNIINQSMKIMKFIKAIEDGVIAKDVLKFITKFYQLDRSYFD